MAATRSATPQLTGLLAIVLAAIAAAIVAGASSTDVLIALAAVFVGIAAAYLIWNVDPAYTLSAAMLLTVFSGYWDQMGIPGVLSPDRPLVIAGAFVAVMRAEPSERRRLLRMTPVHWVLLLSITYVAISAARVGTINDQSSLFKLVQSFGVLPFLIFVAAPFAFKTPRQRNILLTSLVGLGAYLGITALLETTRAYGLIWPRYIVNPHIGIHFGHARGPFVQAAINGFALFACGTAAMIARLTWESLSARRVALAVTGLCFIGDLLTLQRAIWVALAVASMVAVAMSRELRRIILPVLGAAVVAAALIVALVPAVSADLTSVIGDSENVRGRQITDDAAVAMIGAQPLTGFGWDRYHDVSPRFLVQPDDFPLIGGGLNQVHNLYLSYGADLGLIGVGLWLLGLGLALGGAMQTRGPPDFMLWRRGLVLIAVFFAVAAAFTPSSAAFPILALWLWIGVVWAGRYENTSAASTA